MKKIIALSLALAILSVTASAFAKDVYATKRGKKYHNQVCRFISKRDVMKMEKQEAEEKNLTPCKFYQVEGDTHSEDE